MPIGKDLHAHHRNIFRGMGREPLLNRKASFNTTYDFVHYRLTFPVEDCLPLISGNYAVVVFDENNPDEIMLIRRFYVSGTGSANQRNRQKARFRDYTMNQDSRYCSA